MRVDNSAGKGISGMDKYSSTVDRMNLAMGVLDGELGSVCIFEYPRKMR
jgi:hypothetical protein